MEKVILSGALILIWIGCDPWILKMLNHIPNAKLRKASSILQVQIDEDWQKLRYQRLQRLRLLIPMTFLFDDYVGLFFALMGALWFSVQWPVYRLSYLSAKRVALVRYQFPIYLRQLQVLLQNNTVVKTIELSLDYVPSILKRDIEELYQKIKDEPLNLGHYLDCMRQYELPEIQRAMKWLYRYQSIGYHDAYRQFNRMIVSTSKWLRKSRFDQRQQAIMLVQWLGMLPLMGVTLVFIAAMMSVALSLFERG